MILISEFYHKVPCYIRSSEMSIRAFFTLVLQAFLPAMIEKKAGHVVNIASLAGHSGTNKLVRRPPVFGWS
jgi:hypothetical protein